MDERHYSPGAWEYYGFPNKPRECKAGSWANFAGQAVSIRASKMQAFAQGRFGYN